MKKILVIDPGEHIGLIYVEQYDDRPTLIEGWTIAGEERLKHFWHTITFTKPDIVVFEKFALRAKSAQKLVGNTFITCEVIGLIKLYCQLYDVEPIELLPSCKEYCGFTSNPKDPHYKDILIRPEEKITEHVRDAFRLYNYYKLFGNK